MRKEQAMPSKYLGKVDFPQPTLVTISRVDLQEVKNDSGNFETKAVMYVSNPSNVELDTARGIILNVGNWDSCEEISGQPDSDDWCGTEIVVYEDPSVMFAGKKVGGLRIRAKNTSAPLGPAVPAKVEEPPPPTTADEVPF
jgi:hypothetical protein